MLKNQRPEGKHCRSWWDSSLWAISSGSSVFANSAIVVLGFMGYKFSPFPEFPVTVWPTSGPEIPAGSGSHLGELCFSLLLLVNMCKYEIKMSKWFTVYEQHWNCRSWFCFLCWLYWRLMISCGRGNMKIIFVVGIWETRKNILWVPKAFSIEGQWSKFYCNDWN